MISTVVLVNNLKEKVENFTINFENLTEQKLNLVFLWDTTKVEVPIEIQNVEETLQIIDHLKNIRKIEGEIKKKNEAKK